MRRRGCAQTGGLGLGWQVLRVGERGVGNSGSAGIETRVLQSRGGGLVGWGWTGLGSCRRSPGLRREGVARRWVLGMGAR